MGDIDLFRMRWSDVAIEVRRNRVFSKDNYDSALECFQDLATRFERDVADYAVRVISGVVGSASYDEVQPIEKVVSVTLVPLGEVEQKDMGIVLRKVLVRMKYKHAKISAKLTLEAYTDSFIIAFKLTIGWLGGDMP